jgi:hypothetical protein
MLLPLLSVVSVLTPYGLNVRFVRFGPGEIYGWGFEGVGSSLKNPGGLQASKAVAR